MCEIVLKSLEQSQLTRRSFLKLTVSTLALGGAFRGPVVLAQPPVVPVGTLFDYTGALAEFGPLIRNGADLAAKHLNDAARDVLGGPIIRLIHEDSGTTASIGIDKAKKLVDVDKVPAMVGSLASGVTMAVATTVTSPNKVVQISPASTSLLITALKDDDFLFRTTSSAAFQGVVLGQLAAGQIVPGVKFKTASTLYVNNPDGKGLTDIFERAFAKRGGKVLAAVAHPEEPKPSYMAELQRALIDKPDVLVAISYPGHVSIYLKEAIEVLKYKSFLFVDSTKSAELIKAVGAANLEGMHGTAPGADTSTPSYANFIAEYAKTYGAPLPPLPFIDMGYDAVMGIGLAVAKALQDKAPINGTSLRDRLRPIANPPGVEVGAGPSGLKAALDAIKAGKDINYTGASGAMDFDETGDVITAIEVWRYARGTMVTVAVLNADRIPPE